jgi:hypothetical protein
MVLEHGAQAGGIVVRIAVQPLRAGIEQRMLCPEQPEAGDVFVRLGLQFEFQERHGLVVTEVEDQIGEVGAAGPVCASRRR